MISKFFLRFHRWAGIFALAFWIAQAASGVIIVFAGEIDDATISAPYVALDPDAMEQGLASIAPAGSDRTISSVWTSPGLGDRFDVFVSSPDGGQEIRVNGAGEVIRVANDNDVLANGAWLENIIVFHHNLLLSDAGEWIVGISGILLITNIGLGIWLGLRGSGGLKRRVVPVRPNAKSARFYSWHRAVGLWAAIPAILIAATGVLLTFYDTTEAAVNPSARTLPALTSPAPVTTDFSDAVKTAMGEFPTAKLTAVTLPTEEDKSYVIRLLQPEESREIYGVTTVIVSAVDGSIRGSFDALEAPVGRSFMDALFPLHTGEFGGLTGRILSVLIGLWLLTVSILGFRLWLLRRRSRH